MKDFDGIDEGGLDEGEGEQGAGRRLQAIMDRQASHTSSVAGMIYARLISERDGTVASTRARFRTVSCMWHLWLGFDTTLLFSAASRRDSQNFTFGHEVVPSNRVAVPIRCRLHACCLDETRRNATPVETQRGDLGSVRALGLPQTTIAARHSNRSLEY